MAPGESGSARGDVVSVEVRHDSARPYRITLAGHRFAYDVALLPGSDPPTLADLRLVALGAATPVDKRDLQTAGNVLDRLAWIAAKRARRGDAESDRAATERVREALVAKFGDELAERGLDADSVTLNSYEAPGPVLIPAPPKRRRGRPARSTEFYRRVADAALDAKADPDIRNIAKGVQARAAGWPEVDGTPPLSTVERWLKVARKLGEYQGPRAQIPTHPTTTNRGESER